MASSIVCVRCTRCKREKYIYLDSIGRRIGKPYYANPKDYPKTHRYDSDQLGAEAIKRSVLITTWNGTE